jgi:hypothetical protein
LKEGQPHHPPTLAYADGAATKIDISKFPFIAEAAFIKLWGHNFWWPSSFYNNQKTDICLIVITTWKKGITPIKVFERLVKIQISPHCTPLGIVEHKTFCCWILRTEDQIDKMKKSENNPNQYIAYWGEEVLKLERMEARKIV